MTYIKTSKYTETALGPHVANCVNQGDSLILGALSDLNHMKILASDGFRYNLMKVASYDLH